MPDDSAVLARRGAWVQIHQVLLRPGERAPQVPPETQAVPLEMWVKGFLVDDSARCSSQVEIETVIGRRHRGMLVRIEPAHEHGFGEPLAELLTVGSELRAILGLPHRAATRISAPIAPVAPDPSPAGGER